MAREVDVLAGLRWEEVGDAGPCGAQTAAGAEAPLDPPVPPGIGRPHPDRARQFMPFAALRGYYDLVHAKEAVPESRRPLSDDEAGHWMISSRTSTAGTWCAAATTRAAAIARPKGP